MKKKYSYLDIYNSHDIRGELRIRTILEEKGEVLMTDSSGKVVKLNDKDFLSEFDIPTNEWLTLNYQPLDSTLTDISNLDKEIDGFLRKKDSKWIIDTDKYLVYEELLDEFVQRTDIIEINGFKQEIGNNPIFFIETKSNLSIETISEDNIFISNDNGDGVVLTKATSNSAGLLSSELYNFIIDLDSSHSNLSDLVLFRERKNIVTDRFSLTDENENELYFKANSLIIGNKTNESTLNISNIGLDFNDINTNFNINYTEGIKSETKYGNKTISWSIKPFKDESSDLIMPKNVVDKVIVTSMNGVYADEFGDIKVLDYIGGHCIEVTDNNVINLLEHNHDISGVIDLEETLDSKANLDSPLFIGNPQAPTLENDDISDGIATTNFIFNQKFLKIEDAPIYLPNEKPLKVKVDSNGVNIMSYLYNGIDEQNLFFHFSNNLNAINKNGIIEVDAIDTKYTSTNGIIIEDYTIKPIFGETKNTLVEGNDYRLHTHNNKDVLDKITNQNIIDLELNTNSRHEHPHLNVLNDIKQSDVNNWNDANVKKHTHENKTVLDDITQERFSNWEIASNLKHEHSNLELLDTINDNRVGNWDLAFTNNHVHENKVTLDKMDDEFYDSVIYMNSNYHIHDNLSSLNLITTSKINSWDLAFVNNHIHSNLEVLELIDETIFNEWNLTKNLRHVHDNKEALDSITDNEIEEWNKTITIRHTHENKNVLDSITDEKVLEWNSLSNKSHTHSNIVVLDNIKQSDVDKWDYTTSISHTHDNKLIIDNIKASNVEDWNNATSKSHEHHNMLILNSISQTNIDEWNYSKNNSHVHINKTVLDGITQEKINNYQEAFDLRHTHLNKDVLDKITQDNLDNWNNPITHTHENKLVLDGITAEDVYNWNLSNIERHKHTNFDLLETISQDSVNNWNTSFNISHSHNNKSTLDNIKETNIVNWNLAFTNNHTHHNLDILDTITSEKISQWNSSKTLDNFDLLNNLTDEDINNWNDANDKKHIHTNKEILDGIDEVFMDDIFDLKLNKHTHSNKDILDSITVPYTEERDEKLQKIYEFDYSDSFKIENEKLYPKFGTEENTFTQGNDERLTKGVEANMWGNHKNENYVKTINDISPIDGNVTLNLDSNVIFDKINMKEGDDVYELYVEEGLLKLKKINN